MNFFEFGTKVYNYIVVHIQKSGCLNFLSDSAYIRFMYFLYTKKKVNLSTPHTFSEKIQWLKLHDCKPLYTVLVDKYAVKQYVADKIGKLHIIPTLGVWKKFEDIDFDKLPNQFVLKCTHDSGGLVVCKDKSELNLAAAQKKIGKSLKRNFFYIGREKPYQNVPPQIIAEKYMEDESGELKDYKFYCFNGTPLYCQVIRNRSTKETIDFYDMEWNHMPFVGLNPAVGNGLNPVEKPKCLDAIVEACKKLSNGIPFVRVDFYVIANQFYFGEMTFYPASGFGIFSPDEWNYKLGELIKLPLKKN